MARTPNSEQIMPELTIAAEMPKASRGKSRTKAVDALVDAVRDGEVHILQNVTEDNKDSWSRKVRYAARLAGKTASVVWAPEENPPGLYFYGKERDEDTADAE